MSLIHCDFYASGIYSLPKIANAYINFFCRCGGMVDAVDSKSTLSNKVQVQVLSSAMHYPFAKYF